MENTEKKWISSVLGPGNVKAKINSLSVQTRPYKNDLGNDIYDIMLHLESEPVKGLFKGLKIDMNNPASKEYLGQVGRVRLSQYGFSDGVTKTGIEVTAEGDMARALKSLFIDLDLYEWYQQQDGLFKTHQLFIDFVNKENILNDKYLYYCLATRQYVNKKGYLTDDLYLPRYNKEIGAPFATQMEKLIKFNAEVHITKPKEAVTQLPKANPTEVQKEKIVETLKEENGLPNIDKLPWD